VPRISRNGQGSHEPFVRIVSKLDERQTVKALRIVVPVFNDWESFGILLRELDQVAGTLSLSLTVSAINDGSTLPPPAALLNTDLVTHLQCVDVVHLSTNMGHQRAIAVGLCLAVEDADADAILVMDADGEDSPAAIRQMLDAAGDATDFCVVARRGKRTANWTFKLSYLLYKLLFNILTGHQIAFGNFCLLSNSFAKRLVRISDLWNNLPAAILHSRFPIKSVFIDRSERYAGKSKMNLTSLVVHGLSGISVYAETIFVRLLFLTFGLFVFSSISIVFVLTLRIFFPRHATPGWATTVVFGMSIILVQTLSFTLSFVLMLFNLRVQRLIIPIEDYRFYVDSRQILFNGSSAGI
jgi:glycosyltransferase involved in cell wall biosynthesis